MLEIYNSSGGGGGGGGDGLVPYTMITNCFEQPRGHPSIPSTVNINILSVFTGNVVYTHPFGSKYPKIMEKKLHVACVYCTCRKLSCCSVLFQRFLSSDLIGQKERNVLQKAKLFLKYLHTGNLFGT